MSLHDVLAEQTPYGSLAVNTRETRYKVVLSMNA